MSTGYSAVFSRPIFQGGPGSESLHSKMDLDNKESITVASTYHAVLPNAFVRHAACGYELQREGIDVWLLSVCRKSLKQSESPTAGVMHTVAVPTDRFD